jgi:hypothetical protein
MPCGGISQYATARVGTAETCVRGSSLQYGEGRIGIEGSRIPEDIISRLEDGTVGPFARESPTSEGARPTRPAQLRWASACEP